MVDVLTIGWSMPSIKIQLPAGTRFTSTLYLGRLSHRCFTNLVVFIFYYYKITFMAKLQHYYKNSNRKLFVVTICKMTSWKDFLIKYFCWQNLHAIYCCTWPQKSRDVQLVQISSPLHLVTSNSLPKYGLPDWLIEFRWWCDQAHGSWWHPGWGRVWWCGSLKDPKTKPKFNCA